MSGGSLWPVRCAHCDRIAYKGVGAINRAVKVGMRLYCDRACSSAGRRLPVQPTEAEKRSAKAEYDRQYRGRKADELRAKKAAYFRCTYDPDKAREVRKGRAPMHAEYCRRPEYRKWKQDYDRKHLAKKHYGPFAEAALILRDLEEEVSERATRIEIYQANGTINKSIKRRREYAKAIGC